MLQYDTRIYNTHAIHNNTEIYHMVTIYMDQLAAQLNSLVKSF